MTPSDGSGRPIFLPAFPTQTSHRAEMRGRRRAGASATGASTVWRSPRDIPKEWTRRRACPVDSGLPRRPRACASQPSPARRAVRTAGSCALSRHIHTKQRSTLRSAPYLFFIQYSFFFILFVSATHVGIKKTAVRVDFGFNLLGRQAAGASPALRKNL